MLEWTYAGVNFSHAGAGGEKCVNYIPLSQRLCETLFYGALFTSAFLWAWPKLRLPFSSCYIETKSSLTKLLLVMHCLTFGVELGYKFSTRSLIWALNPCHILTILQIVLLMAPSCPLVTAGFRLHIHMLNGPLLALLFPVLNTRLLPFEHTVYFLQHVLLVIIPASILRQNTVYSVEPLDDLSWVVLSLSIQVLYHFLVLQPIGLLTSVNLNNIICPAISDPFPGPHYRLFAMLHQPALILVLGKMFTWTVLKWRNHPLPWQTPPVPLKGEGLETNSPVVLTFTKDQWVCKCIQSGDSEILMVCSKDSNGRLERRVTDSPSGCWSNLLKPQSWMFMPVQNIAHENLGCGDATAKRRPVTSVPSDLMTGFIMPSVFHPQKAEFMKPFAATE